MQQNGVNPSHAMPANTVTACSGISQYGWSVVEGSAHRYHVPQFHLIGRGHDRKIGDAAQIRQIVTYVMGWSVVPHQADAVQYHAYRQILYGDVVHHQIVPPLKEGGIDAAERCQPLARHASKHGHGVLLRDPDVVGTLRKSTPEDVHPHPAGHGRCDPHHHPILGGGVDESVGEYGGEGRRGRLALHLPPRFLVELGDPVHAIRGALRWRVSHPLGGFDVQEHRLVVWRIPQLLEDGYQVIDIVPVDRSHVIKFQLFEQRLSRNDAPGVFADPLIDRLHLL